MAHVLTFAFCLILAGTGIQFMVRTLTQRSSVLEVPIWVVYAAVPVGALLEALCMLVAPRRESAGERGPEAIL